MLHPGTLSPTQQTAIQATAATTPDEGPEDDDESVEGEDFLDDDDDDYGSDEDALNDGEDPNFTAFGTYPSNQMTPTLDAAEVEHSLLDADSPSEDETFDLPDLEEIPVADQIDQTTEGNG